MSKFCIVTAKKTTFGYNVSHAKNKTKRKVFANLQKKTLVNPASGRKVTVTISNNGLRTLKKWAREGKTYDLTKLKADGTLAV